MISASESTPTLISWLIFKPSREAQHGRAPRMWSGYRASVVAKLRTLAPYAGVLVLPGGSLMALLLWFYRRQRRAAFLATRDPTRRLHLAFGPRRRTADI
jgi:hypothetical protein